MKLRIFLLAATVALALSSCGKDDAPETANNAPQMANQNTSAPEDTQPGPSFYTVVASDDDGDKLEFSISENDNGLFTINSDSGTLSLASGQSLDFSASQTHIIIVSVTDGTDTTTATITITVTEGEVIVVGAAPIMDNQEFEVGDNVSDTDILAMIVATDEDTEILEFSIKTDNADIFEITTGGELSLKDGAVLDYWEDETHELEVSVTDNENIVDAIITLNVNDKRSFITTWITETDGETISIGTDSELTYDYRIRWGDGESEEISIAEAPSHQYAMAGTYEIKIRGDFPHIQMEDNPSAPNLASIEQWGSIQWESFEKAFSECINLTYNAEDTPNLSMVTNMQSMFDGAESFDGDLNDWDVSKITDMSYMFSGAVTFNGNIAEWNVLAVEDMNSMFAGATVFNQDISEWEVDNVTDMFGMFRNTDDFDQPIGEWNVGKVKNMGRMFANTKSFDQELKGWATSSVTNMYIMFINAESFNRDLSEWDVSNVSNFNAMFKGATAFDQNLGDWNLSKAEDFTEMLRECGLSAENYDATLSGWANSSNTPSDITFGAEGLYFCTAYEARQTLIQSKFWVITDAGFHPNCEL